jgi:predicted PurR-regulated permease PerM
MARPDDGGSDAGTDSGRDPIAALRAAAFDRERLVLWAVAAVFALGLWLFVWRFVGVLVVGLFVYYVTRPLFARIHGRVGGRTRAVVIAILTVAVPTLLLIGWTVAVVVQAVTDFLGSEAGAQVAASLAPAVDVPAELSDVDRMFRELLANPREASRQLGPLVSTALDGVVGAIATLGTVALEGFVVLVITFYLLRDDVRLAAWARRTFDLEGTVTERYLVRVDGELQTIFFGNILNALATGLIAVAAYLALNTIAPPVVTIPQATLVGLLVGVASLVPAVGIKLVTWPLGFYLVGRSLYLDPETIWFPAVFFLVSLIIVDAIPDQLLRPYVSGRRLHIGAVMLAYLFGPLLFGWYGLFLGPFLLVVVWQFGQVVLPWLTGAEASPAAAGEEMGDSASPDAGTDERLAGTDEGEEEADDGERTDDEDS